MDEFEIIKKWIRPVSTAPIVLGKGDDCSLVEWDSHRYLLQTSDVLIEDVHFRLSHCSARDLSWKSLAVSISDVAAMGGRPEWAHLTLGLPSNIPAPWIEEFFEGFYELSEKHNISLVGGDISRSPHSVFIDVHMSGRIQKTQCKFRKGLSQVGHLLCVTGSLGNSGAGLFALENRLEAPESLVQSHRRPPVELDQACFLGRQPEVSGMTDLSDGLFSDLRQIPLCRIEIQLEDLPQSKDLLTFASEVNIDPLQWSLGGGEDYRLLFSIAKSDEVQFRRAWKKKFNDPFFIIGQVIEGEPEIIFLKDRRPLALEVRSFKHFT